MLQHAYFAAGCFWSVEHIFRAQTGVVETRTGFMGGHTENPTYEQVCHKQTGHAETVEVIFDTAKTDFETLARIFFEIHDPVRDRRAKGGQYRSAVFYATEQQRTIVQKLIDYLKMNGLEVVTELKPAGSFYTASDRHQNYYGKLCKLPEGRSRVKRHWPESAPD